jgi:hypothetical protein
MARISTYANDTSIQLTDKLLGTDNTDKSTKNFEIGDILAFILGNGTVNYLPVYNNDGTLQDSVFYQDDFANPTIISTKSDFFVGGDTSISGALTTNGVLNVNSDIYFNGAVYDVGGNIGAEGQVLTAAVGGEVKWKSDESGINTILITVASIGAGNGYFLDGVQQANAVLQPGFTYRFDQSNATNNGHPLRFSSDSANSSPYTTGVTAVGTPGSPGAYTQIITTQATPVTLYYYCTVHSGMGGAATIRIIQTDSNAIFPGDLEMPSYIRHTGDTSTYIGFSANDTIDLATDSNVVLRIDSLANSTFAGLVSGITPVDAANFATKAYVDAVLPADSVSGTGTLNAVAKFDAAGSIIGSSSIIDNGTNIGLGRNANANFAVDMGDAQAGGLPIAIRNGLIISNNPSLPQVDNTSVIIGAGNQDIIAGSDHSLTVGNGNQIQSNSDCTITTGTNNTVSNSNNSIVGGSSNTIEDSLNAVVEGNNNALAGLNNSIVLGNSNNVRSNVGGGSHFVYGIDNDIVAIGTTNTPTNCFTLGSNIDITTSGGAAHRNMFNIGFDLTPVSQTMTLGYDNNTATYPAADGNRGVVKFVVNTYVDKTASTKNALLITEGSEGQNKAPMIVLPNLVDQEYADDPAAAIGNIPVGGLYHTAGVIKIRRS